MTDEVVFEANGYLEKSWLDTQGAKHVTFEFTVQNAVEIAKLELMSRDLSNVNVLPVLLTINVKVADGKEQGGKPGKEEYDFTG